MLRLLFFILPLSYCINLHTQERAFNELIIQLEPFEKIETALEHLNSVGIREARLKRKLSEDMRIYLIESSDTINDKAITLSKNLTSISIAQFNHRVKSRIEPNDTFFDNQWPLHNFGQFSGLEDADIDADSAWDITSGGTTVLGDSIVVAVIDAGFHINHPDLKKNIFVNRNEIPNDSIDNDNNGYMDDFMGWDDYEQDSELPKNDHGTHIAGIIGAKGNNSIGISGVNWNVKVLPIAGSSAFEAQVISSYSYILKMRRLYNQTQGQKGAYIVSTNASFGVDAAFPDSYPLWCTIYDSLGKEGIVSVAATSNLNINVDLQGDIPTTCPSQYLISVTNTNNSDVKVNAGYGNTHIDLAAPGQQIYSTVSDSAYMFKSGTSMASPHVAGAIALMYSGACDTIIELSHSHPDSAARLMRFLLLDAVDTLDQLKSKVHSKGRLNLHKAVLRSTCEYLNQPEQQIKNEYVYIFPNPGRESLTIRASQIINQALIYNWHGQLIYSNRNNISNEIKISSSNISSGIYLIHVRDINNNHSTIRWTKH